MAGLEHLIDSRLAQLPHPLALEWPGGRSGERNADLRLKLRDRRFLSWLAQGRIGHLADAYVRGEVDIEGSLSELMAVAAALVGDPVRRGERPAWPGVLKRWRSLWLHRRQRDAHQVRFHYDVCDEFFALWLDPLRVYSCAYFADSSMTLAQAQEAKLELLCRKLRLSAGLRLLDIGAGWGGLLLWAAQHYGVRAVGITLSQHQHAHVQRLIEDKGLSGQVEIRLLDYRDLHETGGFDRIASVGMFEHVGSARLPAYFSRLASLLRPGGLMINHGISAGGLHNEQLGAGMGDFIDTYIFPGGELVHVAHAIECLAQGGLELLDAENLRPHYARTLWAWSEALEAHLDQARQLTNETTVRAYRLYLAGCAMSFQEGWLSLYQLLAANPCGDITRGPMPGAQSVYPFNRSYMYRDDAYGSKALALHAPNPLQHAALEST